jgi:DNA-directed RNA polymerase subunit RPC12/RpoP
MSDLLLILFSLVSIGVFILVLKTVRDQTRRKAAFWGVNFRRVNCPKCGHKTPVLRKPRSVRQALWGGWTCSGCGTEMDKLGTDISSSIHGASEILPSLNQAAQKRQFDEKDKSPVERVIEEE